MQVNGGSSKIEQEVETLKSAFGYRCFQHDLDFLYDDLDREVFSEHNLAGRTISTFATDFLFDCYFEKQALEPLVKVYAEQGYRVASRFDRLLQHLMDAGRHDLIEKFWTSITRLTRAEFLHYRRGQQHGAEAFAQEYKGYALEAYSQGIEWLEKVGATDAAAKMRADKIAVNTDAVSSLPAPTDLRKIDEPVYWELINRSAENATVSVVQVDTLGELLSGFKAADIKRFGAIYAKQMKALYHWNAWALGYAARGGCSDSAFEEFRTWLILQGDPELLKIAVTEPDKAASHVPKNPDLPSGSLQAMLDDIYFLRTGESLSMSALELSKPKGKKWSEREFSKTHPQLSQYYT